MSQHPYYELMCQMVAARLSGARIDDLIDSIDEDSLCVISDSFQWLYCATTTD